MDDVPQPPATDEHSLIAARMYYWKKIFPTLDRVKFNLNAQKMAVLSNYTHACVLNREENVIHRFQITGFDDFILEPIEPITVGLPKNIDTLKMIHAYGQDMLLIICRFNHQTEVYCCYAPHNGVHSFKLIGKSNDDVGEFGIATDDKGLYCLTAKHTMQGGGIYEVWSLPRPVTI